MYMHMYMHTYIAKVWFWGYRSYNYSIECQLIDSILNDDVTFQYESLEGRVRDGSFSSPRPLYSTNDLEDLMRLQIRLHSLITYKREPFRLRAIITTLARKASSLLPTPQIRYG